VEKLHAPEIIGREAPSPAWLAALSALTWATSLRIGLLADDFDLVPGAGGARLADVVWAFGHSYTAPPVVVYRPLYLASFVLDAALWNGCAVGYHLTNVVLHALNAVMVAGLAARLRLSSVAAWRAGAVFAVHPLAIGAVGWVSGRADVGVTTFVLAALLAWRSGRTGLACLATLAALLEKENSVVLLPWLALLALVPPRPPLRTLLGPLATLLAFLTFRLKVIGPMRSYFEPWSIGIPTVIGGLMRLGLNVAWPLSDGVLRSRALDLGLTVAVGAAVLQGLARRVRSAWIPIGMLAASLLPVLPLLIVGRGLYDSRHYYLALVPIALLLALAASNVPRAVFVLLLAALATIAQFDIAHWRRNSLLAGEIVEATSRAASQLPPGTRLGVAGYRDLEGGYFLFLGNSLQAAVQRIHPELVDRPIQCLGTGICPPESSWPAGTPLLRLEIDGWRVAGARLERGTIGGL
jgi:hypothetical protein